MMFFLYYSNVPTPFFFAPLNSIFPDSLNIFKFRWAARKEILNVEGMAGVLISGIALILDKICSGSFLVISLLYAQLLERKHDDGD